MAREHENEVIENIYDVHCAASDFLEGLIGRELSDSEFDELKRILRGLCRVSRTATAEDLDEYGD